MLRQQGVKPHLARVVVIARFFELLSVYFQRISLLGSASRLYGASREITHIFDRYIRSTHKAHLSNDLVDVWPELRALSQH